MFLDVSPWLYREFALNFLFEFPSKFWILVKGFFMLLKRLHILQKRPPNLICGCVWILDFFQKKQNLILWWGYPKHLLTVRIFTYFPGIFPAIFITYLKVQEIGYRSPLIFCHFYQNVGMGQVCKIRRLWLFSDKSHNLKNMEKRQIFQEYVYI